MRSTSVATAEHAGSAINSKTSYPHRLSPRTTARVAAYGLLFAAAYDLSIRLGLGFRFQNSQIGVVWPANALLVSALILTRRSRWWIVFVAAAVPHALEMHYTVPAWRWIWQIVGNFIFATSTVLVLDRAAGM